MWFVSMVSQDQIKSIAGTISRKFKTKKILLFGFYAFGEPELYSDIDLCVIASLGGKRKIDVIRDIRREINKNFNIPLDILLYEDKEFSKRASVKNSLEYKILHDGIVINK